VVLVVGGVVALGDLDGAVVIVVVVGTGEAAVRPDAAVADEVDVLEVMLGKCPCLTRPDPVPGRVPPALKVACKLVVPGELVVACEPTAACEPVAAWEPTAACEPALTWELVTACEPTVPSEPLAVGDVPAPPAVEDR
jgi:hypothetical protein